MPICHILRVKLQLQFLDSAFQTDFTMYTSLGNNNVR